MRDRPDGAGLLWQARAVLLRELLAELPESKRYDGLMVAAAMAIAARELEAGEAPLRRHHAALAAFLGEDVTPPIDETELRRGLDRLLARLAKEIRAGERDDDPRVFRLLRDLSIDQLRESNPKVLQARGID